MASLRHQCSFAISVGAGCAAILKPSLEFLAGGRDAAASAGISVVDAAVILLVFTTICAFLAVVSVCTSSPEDSTRLTALRHMLAFILVLLGASALIVLLFLYAGK